MNKTTYLAEIYLRQEPEFYLHPVGVKQFPEGEGVFLAKHKLLCARKS
jgi:hypothetical protein